MFLMVALASIGAVTVASILLDALWSPLETLSSYLMPYFLPSEVEPLSKRFGPWAVVTGCTDGIGKQYALELARRGLNLVLISRNPDKLRATATEIENTHSVKTKIIVADFSLGPAVYDHIEKELENIPVGILVNNVGVNYEYPMPLTEVPPQKAWELVLVNVGAVTAMTRMLLPRMVAAGRGALVNVSSGSELQPLPLMAVYAATKAYTRSLTLAVRAETAGSGVLVQHVAPLFVSTNMNLFSRAVTAGGALVPTASTYAAHAAAALGRCATTTGYWPHGLQYFAITLCPEWLRTRIGHRLNRQFRAEYFQNARIKDN